jgi:DNA transposition AAA+ family ATPase
MQMTEIAMDVVSTKQYRRFAEFCDTVKEEKYIGLCYGPPGVGKTFSARQYSRWHLIEDYYDSMFTKTPSKAQIQDCRTLFYTATVNSTAKIVQKEISVLSRHLCETVQDAVAAKRRYNHMKHQYEIEELLIVDEADRLKLDALEQIRDLHDRRGIGVILIGMPGLEKRLTRYPQLYSRVGFVHEFESMSVEEVKFILEKHCQKLSLSFSADDFTDQETLASVARITHGNFRLLRRLLSQCQRIMKINNLKLLTKEVIEAARNNLVIGVT